MKRRQGPPAFADRLLRRALGDGAEAFILGDLREEYGEWMSRGPAWRARLRFCVEALVLAIRIAFWRLALRESGGFPAGGAAGARGDRGGRGAQRDLRFVLRGCRRRPALSAAVVATFALGLGVATTTASIAYQVLLSPLPYPDTDRLVVLRADFAGQSDMAALSTPEYLEMRDRVGAFDTVAGAWVGKDVVVDGVDDEHVGWLVRYWVTKGFFTMFGARPEMGEDINVEQQPYDGGSVVVSHEFWRSALGADPEAIGRRLTLWGGRGTTRSGFVTGVLPEGFTLWSAAIEEGSRAPAMAIPMPPDWWSTDYANERLERWIKTFARLAPAATLPQAQAQLDALADDWRRDHAGYDGYRIRVVPLHRDLVSAARPTVLLSLLAAAAVLLIACANVAGLLLVDGIRGRNELAIQSALGASRIDLLRQAVMRALILAVGGGLAGALLASWGVRLLASLAVDSLPRLADAHLNIPVLLAGAVLTLLSGVGAGIVPALAVRSASGGPLDGSRGRSSHGINVRGQRYLLTVGQLCLATVLLIGVGLLGRAAWLVLRADLGFDPSGLRSIFVYAPPDRDALADRLAYSSALRERLLASPDVEAVGFSDRRLHSTVSVDEDTAIYSYQAYEAEEDPADVWGEQLVENAYVGPYYLQTVGARLVAGRMFTDDDLAARLRVAVVDETLARRAWPGQDPLGKRLRVGNLQQDRAAAYGWTVIGVVRHMQRGDVTRPEERMPQFYGLDTLTDRGTSRWVVARTSLDTAAFETFVQQQGAALSTLLPPAFAYSVAESVAVATRERRFLVSLVGFLALAGTALSCVGLYGTLSHAVASRRYEFGIHMALGSTPERVLRTVLREGLVVVASGAACGVLVAVFLTGYLRPLLVTVSAFDPLVFVAAVAVVAVVGLAACGVPAGRAARVHPSVVLRGDRR